MSFGRNAGTISSLPSLTAHPIWSQLAILSSADYRKGYPLGPGVPSTDAESANGTLITAVELPSQGFRTNYTYLKIRDRLSYAFALVSVAAALELEGDRIKDPAERSRRSRMKQPR